MDMSLRTRDGDAGSVLSSLVDSIRSMGGVTDNDSIQGSLISKEKQVSTSKKKKSKDDRKKSKTKKKRSKEKKKSRQNKRKDKERHQRSSSLEGGKVKKSKSKKKITTS